MAFMLQRKCLSLLTPRLAYPLRQKTFTHKPSQMSPVVFQKLFPEEISPPNNYQIAGREFLPGSNGKGLPKFLRKPTANFPHARMAPTTAQLSNYQWAQECRREIENNLTKFGALLFRGLPVHSVEDFAEFSMGLGYKSLEYIGGNANRTEVDEQAQVYTANEEAPGYTIGLHNEMSYHATFPTKVMFYCLQQPDDPTGGATPICDGTELTKALDPKVVRKLEEKQVRYINRLPDESRALPLSCSWQTVFNTDDPQKVEQYLSKQGCSFSWDRKLNGLKYWRTRPAFINHPETGEKLWFNQSTAAHISAIKALPQYPGDDNLDRIYVYETAYGDGSEIEPEVVEHIRSCMWHMSVGFQWQNADVLILDNFKTLHTRLGYTGERKILVKLLGDSQATQA